MSVIYKRFDGERVSRPWERLLRDLRARGTHFHLNEGTETFARQAELVREKGVWSPENPTGAARPSPFAPHIRTGRFDHACDFDNSAAVEMAARARGVTLRATVPGEPWHLEADRAELLAYYRRRRKEIRVGKRRRAKARIARRLRAAFARLRRRRTSVRGVAMIRGFEGCRLVPYNDPAGFATIGVGHLIARRPVNDRDLQRFAAFSRGDADRLLARDLAPFEAAVRRSPMPLTQNQFDALVSATMNLGPGCSSRAVRSVTPSARETRQGSPPHYACTRRRGIPPRDGCRGS
jgi:GH24 family phage-related lysozyme (muramidase)